MAYPTNPIYKFVKDLDGENNQVKKVVSTNPTKVLFVPLNADGNTDLLEYLEWAKTNTAEDAD